MLVGPVFTREVVTAPRRTRWYLLRATYVLSLLVLMWTAWLLLAGVQQVRNPGDLARFGATVFSILAPLQLALAVFFAALSAASAVALEKDRKTLLLLLLTNLTNSELVLGKLLASVLSVLVLLVAALPLFMLTTLLGGVAPDQVARAYAVTAVAALAAGSLGSTIALWREKTFQALALTVLALVAWLGFWEAVGTGALGTHWGGWDAATWRAAFSPWRAILEATRPVAEPDPALGPLGTVENVFVLAALAGAVLLNAVAIWRVRVWNPSREAAPRVEPERAAESIWGEEQDAARRAAAPQVEGAPEAALPPSGRQTVADLAHAAMARRQQARARAAAGGAPHVRGRPVWDNPVLWREVRTWAYGRKVLLVRLAYLALGSLAAAAVYGSVTAGTAAPERLALVLALLGVLSLVLINAQAVTSLTSERDAKALDLLLVTDLTPMEFVYGKLGGILYNAKEMVLLPLALCGYLWWSGQVTGENIVFLALGLLTLDVFVAVLGLHVGLNYVSSRQAIAVSLGTVFFLLVGVAACLRLMVAFGGSFELQFMPFAGMLLGGALGLYVALGSRNPSRAIGLASLACPLATFYAITSFLLGQPGLVCLSTVAAYGFATAAMLVPAVFEFDVATGRTTGGEE